MVEKNASAALTLGDVGNTLAVEATGAILLTVGADRYRIESHFSFAREPIGWCRLAGRPSDDAGWRPVRRRAPDGTIEISANGPDLSLNRVVRVVGHRIVVSDTLTNVAGQDVGIVYRHEMRASGRVVECLLAGANQCGTRMTAENPSAFVRQGGSSLGWLAEDAVLRLQLAMETSDGRVRTSAERFALEPGKSHTFRWALYPLPGEADYWTFANQVRRDWDVNFTLRGPWTHLDVGSQMDLIRDHDRLKRHLARDRGQVVRFSPWLDYDNCDAAGRPMGRAEYKALCQEAMAAVKRVNPAVICIGAMEGNLVTIPSEVAEALGDLAAGRPEGYYLLSDEQMAIVDKGDLRWKDCLLRDADGRCRIELYYRGPEGGETPMTAIAVYAAPGNGQHGYWLDQAKFLLDDVGLDGLYTDQFNMAFADEQRYSFDKWDGTTVDIDPATGRIARRYTDAALVGIGARRDLAEFVLGKGRFMVVNTFSAVPEMQSIRIHRFNECEWHFDLFGWDDGQIPPLAAEPCKGHFGTPIALGINVKRYGQRGLDNYAKVIMKGAIAFLRHGMLYYHKFGTDMPESDPGAGEYGAINHMFPITPVELGPGFVIGEERVVACVSGTYRWRQERRPKIVVFDMRGLPVAANAEITKTGGEWDVELRVKDWAEIAVVE